MDSIGRIYTSSNRRTSEIIPKRLHSLKNENDLTGKIRNSNSCINYIILLLIKIITIII